MDKHKRAILLLVSTAVLWSMGGMLIKLVNLNPMAIAGMRSAIAALFIMALYKRPNFKFTKFNLLGSFAYAATVIMFVSANKFTTAANAILLQYTAPVYVALFGSWFLGEKINRLDWIAIFLTLAGMSLFFLDELSAGNMFGNILAILSGVAFAWLILLSRKQKDQKPIDSIIYGNIMTAVIGLPFMFEKVPDTNSIMGLLLLGTLQLGLSYILYSIAIKDATAIEGILILIIEPLLNPVWVLFAIGETPGYWAIIGGIIVISSVTMRSTVKYWRKKLFAR